MAEEDQEMLQVSWQEFPAKTVQIGQTRILLEDALACWILSRAELRKLTTKMALAELPAQQVYPSAADLRSELQILQTKFNVLTFFLCKFKTN